MLKEDQTVIDTHLHFWDANQYYRLHNDWLDAKPELKVSFLPPDVKRHFDACGIQQGIIVEAGRDSHPLNRWLLKLAHTYPYIGGVVAGCWVDNPEMISWVEEYQTDSYFLGIRTQPPGPPETWKQNQHLNDLLNHLEKHKLCFEWFGTEAMFAGLLPLVNRHSDLTFIVNHCGCPPYGESLDRWKSSFKALASFPNVVVKLSSTMLDFYPHLKGQFVETLRPVFEFLLENFGIHRLMWGSNWPVETRRSSFEENFFSMKSCTDQLSQTEQAALLGGNAHRIYRLKTA